MTSHSPSTTTQAKHNPMSNPFDGSAAGVITPSQLNRLVKELLSDSLPPLCLEGEVSNYSRSSSGHIYFTLKDARAQVRCAMFRRQRLALGFQPKNGDQVRAWGQVSLYEARGDFQLIVHRLAAAGAGDLARRFEQLKQKLFAEGLFDSIHKRPLPALPTSIGIITARRGAALQDMLSVLSRRFPLVAVSVYDCLVQGLQAPTSIARALTRADAAGHDVLILGRGGGSLEDLYAFNDETLARQVVATRTPLICAVGHDTDFSICDFVADLRAATPSVAAEHAVPDRAQLAEVILNHGKRLGQLMTARMDNRTQRLDAIENRLWGFHPQRRLVDDRKALDEIRRRFHQALDTQLARFDRCLFGLRKDLLRLTPYHELVRARQKLALQLGSTRHAISAALHLRRETVSRAAGVLHELSPLGTIQRGYSVTRAACDDGLIKSIRQLKVGDEVVTRLSDGQVRSTVNVLTPLPMDKYLDP